MATYLVVYKGGHAPATDAERESVMKNWMGWFGSLGSSVKDMGNPFSTSAVVAAGGAVTQGGASQLTGYSVLIADDLDAATTMAKGCPILGYVDGSLEVYETINAM